MSRSSTSRTSLRREPIMLRNGRTPVTSCNSHASCPLATESQWRRRRFGLWVWHDLPRLTRAAKQSCPSRPGAAPRAELAYRARSRGQPCHSVDCRCAQPSCRSKHAPVVLDAPSGTSVAAAHHRLDDSDRPGPPGTAGSGARNRPHACARSASAERLLSPSETANPGPSTGPARCRRVGDHSSTTGTEAASRPRSTRIATLVSLALWW